MPLNDDDLFGPPSQGGGGALTDDDLFGAAPRKTRPTSMWESIQQAATSGASSAMDLLKGAAKEAPLVAARAVNLPRDIISGGIENLADVTGLSRNPDVSRALINRNRQEYEGRKKYEDLLGESKDATFAEKSGRVLTRMAPQVALGAMTGGASLPMQMAAQGGAQGAQSLSEGASPSESALSAGLGAGGASLVKLGGFLRAPFKGYVDTDTLAAFKNLGIEPPAAAISSSPVVQGAEALAGKFIGGQRIADRARNATLALRQSALDEIADAGDPNAVLAGRNIAQDVIESGAKEEGRLAALEAERQAFEQAVRQARGKVADDLADPALAARASEDITRGLSSSRGAFRAQSRQLREGIDEGLGEVAANPEATIGEIDRLLSQGTLPPGDLAYLRNLRAAIAPRRLVDFGGGNEVPLEQALKNWELTPEDLAKPEFQPLLSRFKFREIPRTAAEIQSQIKGMAQNLPYRQGEGVFGTPELKKGIAGRLKAEMSDLVKKADPELGARLARADAFHATNVDPFKADWAKRAFRLKKSGQVSKVGDIINPQMATEDIEQIIKTTGAKDAIGASVLEDIISKASDKTGAVDPTKLAREIGKWRPGNLQAILTQNQMDDLGNLMKKIPEYQMPKGAPQGPATAGDMLRGKWGKPIVGAYSGGIPEKIVEIVVRPSSTPQEIQAAIKSAGPKALPEIQANVLRRIFGNVDKITPESAARAIRDWGGPKKLGTFLKPEQIQSLQDFIASSKGMGQAFRIPRGSQTAFLGNLAAELPRAAGNPLKALRTVGIEVLVSRALSGTKGQKWLTTGLDPTWLSRGVSYAPAAAARAPSEFGIDERRRRADLDALLAGQR